MNIFNIFKKKSVEEYSQFDSFTGIGDKSTVNTKNLLSNNKNWVYVCVDKLSSSISGVGIQLKKYNSKGDDEEVFDHELLTFLFNPSRQLTMRQWIYTHITSLEMTGNTYWKIDKRGKGMKLLPLIATKMTPIVDESTGEISKYKYINGKGKITVYQPEEILHDKTPNLTNPYVGRSTLEPIAEWIDIDHFASEFNRKFFINGAKFGGFIETESQSQETVNLIQAGLEKYVGVSNSHKIGVLPKGAKYSREGQSMSDMQFVEADARYRDKILSAFGIPKSVLGIVDDVNRANAEASEYVFAKYSLTPRVKAFMDFLNEKVVPLMADSEQYYFDYKDFIPKNDEVRLKDAEVSLNKQPYKTINEVRAENGLAPISNGDVVLGNALLEPVGQPEKKKIYKKEPRAEKIDKGLENIAKKTIETAKELKKKGFTRAEEEKYDEEHKTFVARVDEYEKQLRDRTVDFNNRQKNEVIKDLKTIVTKAVKKEDIFDESLEKAIMIDFATPLLKTLANEQGQLEWERVATEGNFDPNSDRLKKAIDKSVNDMADSYNDTTLKLLKTELNDGLANGESLVELSARIEQVYDFRNKAGAIALARSEAFNVANMASREAYIQSDVVKTVKWFTAQDERVCQYCGPMHGKTVGVKDNWFKKGDVMTGSEGGQLKLDYRTITNPPLHTNCRCEIKPDRIEV